MTCYIEYTHYLLWTVFVSLLNVYSGLALKILASHRLPENFLPIAGQSVRRTRGSSLDI